ALGALAFFGGGRHRIEADVGEEDDGGAGHHPGKAVGEERMPVGGVDGARGADNEDQNGHDLDGHHDIVGAGALPHADHENIREDEEDDQRRDVEPGARELAAYNRRIRKLRRQVDMEGVVEDVIQIRREADGHGHVRHSVFEDQVPADDPGNDLAEGGI